MATRVQRGYALGLSFATDLSIAQGFSGRHGGIVVPNPLVLEAEVSKSDIVFTANDQGKRSGPVSPTQRSLCTELRTS